MHLALIAHMTGLSVAESVAPYWVRFLGVLFAYHSAQVAPLAYLILLKARNHWCLAANVVSKYLLVVAIYVYKAFAVATGCCIVPLVSKLGPEGHYYKATMSWRSVLFPIRRCKCYRPHG